VEKDIKSWDPRVPVITKDKLPTPGDIFNFQDQCQVILPFIAFLSPEDPRSLLHIQNPFLSLRRSVAWNCEGVWENNTDSTLSYTKTITYGVTSSQSQSMTNTVGVEVSASTGIGLSTFDVSLNYQFSSTSSSSFSEYKEKKAEETIDVKPRTATALFSKYIWLKGIRLDGSEVISEIGLAAYDDTHYSGCDL